MDRNPAHPSRKKSPMRGRYKPTGPRPALDGGRRTIGHEPIGEGSSLLGCPSLRVIVSGKEAASMARALVARGFDIFASWPDMDRITLVMVVVAQSLVYSLVQRFLRSRCLGSSTGIAALSDGLCSHQLPFRRMQGFHRRGFPRWCQPLAFLVRRFRSAAGYDLEDPLSYSTFPVLALLSWNRALVIG